MVARVAAKWPYFATAAAGFLAAALLTQPWSGPTGGILAEGGDALWLQATTGVSAQAGPFGTDLHVAWPFGYNSWSYPQLGLFLQTLGWLVGGVLGISWAQATIWLLVISVTGNALACLFFLRSVAGDRLPTVSAAAALALGAAPAVLSPLAHINVGTWFLVPAGLGVILRSAKASRKWKIAGFAVVAVLAAISPIWWVIVMVLLVGTLGFVAVVMAAAWRKWKPVKDVLPAAAGIAVGFAFQYAIFSTVPNIGAAGDRSPWESSIYGGRLTDLLLASPFVNKLVPAMNDLLPGASLEFKPIGLLAGLAGLTALVIILCGATPFLRQRAVGERQDVTVLVQMTVATTLFFVAGGLGNLQAALAVLAGGISPARVFARLVIVLGMMGCAWLILILANQLDGRLESRPRNTARTLRGVISSGLVVVIVATWWLDVHARDLRPGVQPAEQQPEWPAVKFLRHSATPCPVAQLPVDAGLTPQLVTRPSDIADFDFRGYVPYLLAPDFMWSYGSVIPSQMGVAGDLPVTLNADHARLLRVAGFCAVLFDRKAADTATARGVKLSGTDVAALGPPSFSSERYQVFLLPES